VCRQRFRTAARRPKEVELDADAAEALVDEDAPTATEIRAAMRQLSFNQRTVLVLREIEGLSYEEIARAMGTSLSAVETLLFRARRALREQLEAAEHDLGCHAVERLISLQLDGKLSRQDKGLLRAHLRTCADCARLARSQRARKRLMPSLIAVPLPASLTGAFGAGAGGGGGILAGKVAALAVSAALVGTGALVTTAVVPSPGNEPRVEAATPQGSPTFVPPAWTPSASLDRALESKPKPTPAKPKPKPAKPDRARQGPDAAAPASGAGSQGANGSGGGVVGGILGGGTTPPPAPLTTLPSVGEVVQGAQDKLPPVPGSLEDAVPPLPPVSIPGVTGSLP
jgi:hypothetical protein